jgi:hypothetical protein
VLNSGGVGADVGASRSVAQPVPILVAARAADRRGWTARRLFCPLHCRLPLLEPLGDHEVFGRAAVRLGDQFERLDQGDVESLLGLGGLLLVRRRRA